MWHDHLFSQRKKATERAVEVGAGDYREEGRWAKFEKGGRKGGGVGNIGWSS